MQIAIINNLPLFQIKTQEYYLYFGFVPKEHYFDHNGNGHLVLKNRGRKFFFDFGRTEGK